jgi:hypothetical protein
MSGQMCPLASLAFIIGWPLRFVRKHADPLAAIYLVGGSCLTGVGITAMFLLYGGTSHGFSPVTASMMTQAGRALALGAQVRLWRTHRA